MRTARGFSSANEERIVQISHSTMGDDKSIKPPSNRTEIVLRNPDDLLRGELGDGLIVENFTTSSLVPPGENYGSTILQVEADVRYEGEINGTERLSLVAKMIPPTEFQKLVFDTSFTFGKEIYMFTDIIPAYRDLEMECEIPETEAFDPLPKLYGSRLTLKEGESKVDEDAVILMENLKRRNYYCGNRKLGLDMPRVKLLIETVARFHADGIAVKLKKQNLFNEFKTRAIPLLMKEMEALGPMFRFLTKTFKKIPALQPHLPKIEKLVFDSYGNEPNSLKPPDEPWGTIVHTDLWVNNIMFRDDETGNPVDVKLVDFQSYGYQNPLQDLVFFLFTSCEKKLRLEHIDDLVDFYYDKLVAQLTILKCDVSLFSRNSFDKQFREAAKLEYMHCMFMTWVLVSNNEIEFTDDVDPEIMLDYEPTEEFCERIAEISLRFIKENWI